MSDIRRRDSFVLVFEAEITAYLLSKFNCSRTLLKSHLAASPVVEFVTVRVNTSFITAERAKRVLDAAIVAV